ALAPEVRDLLEDDHLFVAAHHVHFEHHNTAGIRNHLPQSWHGCNVRPGWSRCPKEQKRNADEALEKSRENNGACHGSPLFELDSGSMIGNLSVVARTDSFHPVSDSSRVKVPGTVMSWARTEPMNQLAQ